MAGCHQLNGSERKAAEVPLVQLHGMQQILAQVNFTAFEQRQYFAARSFGDPDLNLWKALRIAVQELRQHAFDVLRRACDLQDAGISMPEQLRLLLYGTGAIQQHTTARQQLLAFSRQQEPTPDAVEKPQAEFVLEIDDLTRQRGLCDPQVQTALETVPSSATVTKVRACRRCMSAYSIRA